MKSFLILLLSLQYIASTEVLFQVTASCSIFIPWCASINVMEVNTVFPNTLIASLDPFCTDQNGNIVMNAVGEAEDDGYFDNRLEFMGEITHNCTRDGVDLKIPVSLGSYPDSLEEIKRQFHFDVTERGE